MLESNGESMRRVVLVRSWDEGEALLIRQLLASHGIPSHLTSDVTRSLWPIAVGPLAEIRVMVAVRDLDEARRRLADHRRGGFRSLPGGRARETRP